MSFLLKVFTTMVVILVGFQASCSYIFTEKNNSAAHDYGVIQTEIKSPRLLKKKKASDPSAAKNLRAMQDDPQTGLEKSLKLKQDSRAMQDDPQTGLEKSLKLKQDSTEKSPTPKSATSKSSSLQLFPVYGYGRTPLTNQILLHKKPGPVLNTPQKNLGLLRPINKRFLCRGNFDPRCLSLR